MGFFDAISLLYRYPFLISAIPLSIRIFLVVALATLIALLIWLILAPQTFASRKYKRHFKGLPTAYLLNTHSDTDAKIYIRKNEEKKKKKENNKRRTSWYCFLLFGIILPLVLFLILATRFLFLHSQLSVLLINNPGLGLISLALVAVIALVLIIVWALIYFVTMLIIKRIGGKIKSSYWDYHSTTRIKKVWKNK